MRTLHMLHLLDTKVGEMGTTVRNGFKWADLKDRELIDLCVCWPTPENHKIEGIGQVIDLWFGRFHDIPASRIENEHEIESRQYGGLLTSMRRAYGAEFTEENPVTVVSYLRIR